MKTFRFLFLLLPFFTLFSSCNEVVSQGSDPVQDLYSIKKVVDGDTFWIQDGSPKGKKIRLLGIDAPESRKTGRKEIGHYGMESKMYLKRRLAGKRIRLQYDVQKQDRYHRTLAYAYLEDGTFLNEELVRKGYATVLTIPPNVKYAHILLQAQKAARKHQRGLWKP